jgi:hypothetical protein
MTKQTRTPKNDRPVNPSAEEVTNPAAIVSAPQESVQTGESAPTVEPVPTNDEPTEDYSAGEPVAPVVDPAAEEVTTPAPVVSEPAPLTQAQTIQAALAGRIVGGSKARTEKTPADPNAFTRVWLAKDAKMTPEEAKAAQKKVTFEGASMTAYKVPLIKAIREWAAAHPNPKIQEIAKATTAQMLIWIGRQYIVPNVIRSILKAQQIEESEALKTA